MLKILMLLGICLVITPVNAEFDYEAYRQSSFSDIKAEHMDDLLKAGQSSQYVVSAATFKYSLPVSFSKELRKLSTGNKTLIAAWQKTLRVPESFVQLYQQEFKVVFGKEIYWIPVQENLLPHMGSELHPGDTFQLYVVVIGAINNKLVFLTTEFSSDRAPL